MAMKMKKKNSLPDMYSPEKRFSGFFVYVAYWSRKQKKRTCKSSFKKKEKKEQIRNLEFHIIAYFSYCTKGSWQIGCLIFTKKSKIYRNSGGKNNETF